MASDRAYLPLPASAKRGSVNARRGSRRLVALMLLCAASMLVYVRRNDSNLVPLKQYITGMSSSGQIHVEVPPVEEGDDGAHIGKVVQADKADAGVTDGNVDDRFTPTDALRKLANTAHQPLQDAAEKVGGSAWALQPERKPSHTDHVLLMLSAMKNSAYSVPLDATQRATELLPESLTEFKDSILRAFGGGGGADAAAVTIPDATVIADAQLYASQHDAWTAKHRKQSPLTVFSKSYCPFSKKAKALLTRLGAEFVVYEVDLRPDAAQLQQALADLTGHRTFPAIFVRDQMIGGSDDLTNMDNTGVLHGILEGAGVRFH